jgi:hypothetical protein
MTIEILKTFEFDIRGHFKHQPECKKSVVGDMVWLIPEPENEHDEFAIRVLNSKGKDLGYVPSEDNQEILELLGSENAEYCSKISLIKNYDSGETLPYITVYISNDKKALPFQQEKKFALHIKIDDRKTTDSLRGDESNNDKEDDSKNLLIGMLFIVGLIIIAKLISMI